jgi:hypothetical protein
MRVKDRTLDGEHSAPASSLAHISSTRASFRAPISFAFVSASDQLVAQAGKRRASASAIRIPVEYLSRSARLSPVSPFHPNPIAYAECATFNQEHPVGTKVLVRRDDGTVTRTMTRSRAWVLAGVCPVVMVEGIRGSYLLSRVTVE